MYIDVVIFIMQDDVEGVKKAIERVCKDVVESKYIDDRIELFKEEMLIIRKDKGKNEKVIGG